MLYRQTILAIAGLSVSALPLAAQDVVEAGKLYLDNWSYDDLYAGDPWSVEDMFGAEVNGSGGEQIGDVEDLVLNDEGQVVALIAEIGGFWDMGDTHVSVPWDMVEIDANGPIAVPVTQENIDEFDLFASSGLPTDAQVGEEVVEGVDDKELGTGLWRASELIGDYARVRGEEEQWVNFGYVSDLMIDEGEIVATLVTTTSRYGPGTYAYPYRGPAREMETGTWSPNAVTYDLPVLVGDATSLPRFDIEQDRSN